LRSRRVSSTSKILDCVVAHRSEGAPHRSDRYPPVRPVWHCCSTVFGSSVLALWINQGTQWFSGESLETPRTRCSLRQSPLMTRLPRSPGSTLVLRLNQETIHDFILLFMTWPRWPPGPSNEAYLSSPHLEASPATTFHACSSPAPTPVKPQPAPTILSQESVHTTLSITHHTRKRPSTGPRTTHGPQRGKKKGERGCVTCGPNRWLLIWSLRYRGWWVQKNKYWTVKIWWRGRNIPFGGWL
jgi:hypothetical protein